MRFTILKIALNFFIKKGSIIKMNYAVAAEQILSCTYHLLKFCLSDFNVFRET